ncbi:AMP-binding protein [Roseinatronobacter sp. HJB301]|uniref:AMP-binding protein n=1 Tax=Roseinatronobacter alkalisoli TaxID=3028235 RepID=A0ABT5T4B1_9RHOB|nr:AMP-binding protein [Roseinatronobacter sp. HJB301]MDD7969957.1 AMP-binding protein [Roseinatronobacter sp. HJB301]
MSDLLRDFASAVERYPDRVALIDGSGREVTYIELNARRLAFANAWHHKGIRAGDKVLIAMSVDADLYAALAALWTLGATAVLPEPALGLAGLRHAARVTRPRAFCSSGLFGLLGWVLPELWRVRHLRPTGRAATIPDIAHPAGVDTALISFTSGTTGMPKAIPRSHDFLGAQYKAIAPLLHDEQPQRDLIAFPVFVLINIASGQTSVLPNWKMSRLDALQPADLQYWMQKNGVTRALLPPSLCEMLAQAGAEAPLHTVFTGGGPVFPELIDRMHSIRPNLRVCCVYGSTEAEPIAHLEAADITADDRTAMYGGQGLLVGHPVAGIRLRIQNNEIQVAGAHVNRGYLDPAHDAQNKVRDGATIWHRTGDAGRLDAQGRLWLLGRMGTDVKIDGRMCYPFSVEVAARQWPGVRQCALIAVNDVACLAIEGDKAQAASWRTHAAAFGINRVVHVATMPMDKRHRSKIDRESLRASL